MPVYGYYCWVGAVLLELLFAVGIQPPRPEMAAEPFHPNIRIKSQAMPSEAIVFSGPTVDYGVKPALQVADLAARAEDPTPQAHAQMRPEEMPQAKPQPVAKAMPQRTRKRYARRAPPARLADQPFEDWSRSSF